MRTITKAYWVATVLGVLSLPFYPVAFAVALSGVLLEMAGNLLCYLVSLYDDKWFGMLQARRCIKRILESEKR